MKTLSETKISSIPVVKRTPSFLFDTLRQTDAFRLLKKRLEQNGSGSAAQLDPIGITGISGSLASLTAALLFFETDSPILVISAPENDELFENDFNLLVPSGSFFSVYDQLPLAMKALADGTSVLLHASFSDLQQPLCSPDEIGKKLFRLDREKDAGYEKLKNFLRENQFEHREFVEDEGEFSVRGSIIDVFSFGSPEPVRVEFFGDTVTSLRIFDINSQLFRKNSRTYNRNGKLQP